MISMRRTLLLGLMILPLAFTGGCIQWTADTLLLIRFDDPDETASQNLEMLVGLRHILWRGQQDSYEVVGRGTQPREHETHWASADDPGVTPDRYVHISPDGPPEEWPDYDIELLISSGYLPDDTFEIGTMVLFVGKLPAPYKSFPDRLQFSLSQVPLTSSAGPIRTIFVSGRIVAKPASDAEFAELTRDYELRLSDRR